MLIYISGKYSGATKKDIAANIEAAAVVAGKLWEMGHAVICPHLNTSHFEERNLKVTYDDYIKGDLDMISRCDAMVMLENWQESKGANIELEYARGLGMPVYYSSGEYPPLHPTEVRCPQQVQAFREIVGKAYRTHLKKNSDYSPANILVTGYCGLVTRLWDKTARLLSLSGFKFDVAEPGTFTNPKEAQNESVEDTLLDLMVYSVIGLLLRKGLWGK